MNPRRVSLNKRKCLGKIPKGKLNINWYILISSEQNYVVQPNIILTMVINDNLGAATHARIIFVWVTFVRVFLSGQTFV